MDPNGNATKNQEKLPFPAAEPLATQEKVDTTHKGPTGSPSEDQEVLPYASETLYNVQTLEGEAANISHDYKLSEEGEGDTITGNKELRKEGEDEDENI